MVEATPVLFPLNGRRVFVAGHRGMVGSALLRRLAREDCEVLTVTRREVDLRRQADVERWFAATRPDAVIVAAATVGGIFANDTRPAEFLYDNLQIAANVIEAAWRAQAKKLLFLGSSCIYPRLAPQPMVEDALLGGPLEPTNQWYAVAKIAGLKLCAAYRRQYGADFISAQPTNLYGPGDTYDLQASHVVPALIAKTHAAKLSGAREVEIWGTGMPRREFLHVDDLADVLVFLMTRYSGESHVNVGWGEDVSIRELAGLIAEVVGFTGGFRYDTARPDGAPRKLLDVSKLAAMGWRPRIGLREGLADAYRWFLANAAPKRDQVATTTKAL
ncbi:MAG TPA: GDP-L-fucose synthase [Stellaceae bacterium]|nr:GDP-L-fucose synthase [Stellaceae bacterium]